MKNARTIAKHSCYDQMTWHVDGVRHDDRVTAGNIKAALLAVGTKGRFVVYPAHGGVPHAINWSVGIAYLKNLERGFYCHG